MDTTTLKTFLRNMTRGCPRTLVDVIPCDGLDHLQISHYKEAYLIVNSKPSSHQGEHWVAMHLKRKSSGSFRIYFLCSYGLGIEFYGDHFKNFVHGHETIQNTVQLQSRNSDVCGQYALFFLHSRKHGCCLMAIYCKFSHNTRINDNRVRRFAVLKQSLFQNKIRQEINQCCTRF